jgi:hypothetical protein
MPSGWTCTTGSSSPSTWTRSSTGGLLAFADDGVALLSPYIAHEGRGTLGLKAGVPLLRVTVGHLPYLLYHREKVFRSAPSAP